MAALTLIAGLLTTLTTASQPSSTPPLPVPMRNLTWGTLNFLHTTDTHGWHAGHLQESQYSADWGDYVSFSHHLHRLADSKNIDLLVVDTGDRVEGNGLYDASDPQGRYTYEIFGKQHVDVICSGNHELYREETAQRERETMVRKRFGGSYIASNLDWIVPETGERVPVARRYKRFRTRHQKLDIIAFGFLFDFTRAANGMIVQPVSETLKEQWFRDIVSVREKPDLFLVTGHVGVRMDEFRDIFTAIRRENWHVPIIFLGGHAHVRDAVRFDERAVALASGRYFETVGWLGVEGISARDPEGREPGVFEHAWSPRPGVKKVEQIEQEEKDTPNVRFHRRYIDNNLLGYYHHTGLNSSTFPTEKGKDVSAHIAAARKALDLDHVYGCAPRDLWMSRTPVDTDNSIFTWLQNEVLPGIIRKNAQEGPRLAILNTGCVRFDIFKGKFTRDTPYIISPFINRLRVIKGVPYGIAKNLLRVLNGQGQIFTTTQTDTPLDPSWMLAPEQRFRPEFIAPSTSPFSSAEQQQHPLSHTTPQQEGVPGYTTTDDLGDDGDDAVHTPISFYKVPNCIQAELDFPAEEEEPETVDVVYLDFIQPYVLQALRCLGGEYWDKNTEVYVDETFMDLMLGWIRENWLCKEES